VGQGEKDTAVDSVVDAARLRPLPASVRASGLNWPVLIKSGLQHDKSKDGGCDRSRAEIEIESSLSPQVQWQTLFEELLHAATPAGNADLDKAIDKGATLWFSGLRDNGLLRIDYGGKSDAGRK
jgi:hypothetical protein